MRDGGDPFGEGLRYGWCWEDADVLLRALDVRSGDRCLSIASAGDNALALLLGNPAQVVAIDTNPAQLAALALRLAAFRTLEHGQVLELLGARPSQRRLALYGRCRRALDEPARTWLDARLASIAAGHANTGRFDRYVQAFGTRVVPLLHSRHRIRRLLRGNNRRQRIAFYDGSWNTPAWRLLFRVFFSRPAMARWGRSNGQFAQVSGGAADRILARTRHALTEQDPSRNPYLARILYGERAGPLPLFLRVEHFETIRERVDRVTCSRESLENHLVRVPPASYDAFNLSDAFETMDDGAFQRQVDLLCHAARPGARLAYWNLFVAREVARLAPERVRSLPLAERLHREDHAFFYGALRVEQVA